MSVRSMKMSWIFEIGINVRIGVNLVVRAAAVGSEMTHSASALQVIGQFEYIEKSRGRVSSLRPQYM